MEIPAVPLSPYPLMLLSFVSSEAHSEVWISTEELEVPRVEIIFIPPFSPPIIEPLHQVYFSQQYRHILWVSAQAGSDSVHVFTGFSIPDKE